MSASRQKVAWITGAAQGIGAAIAERLREQGCRVVLIDMDGQRLQDRKQTLLARFVDGVDEATIDLSDGARLVPAMQAVVEACGAPDILVNNAGIAISGTADSFPSEAWHRTFAVNVHAPFELIQLCLPNMRKQRWGRIVNVASVSGMRAGTGRLAYGTSKAALIALTRQVAVECATWGVTANAVAPGAVDTELTRAFHADRERIVNHIPARRYGTTQDIASAVGFLVSDDAAYVTGHTLAVDGGFMCAGFLLSEQTAQA